MATLVKAELCDRVLAYLGELSVGESTPAADAALVDEVIDASFAGLARVMTLPFALDAIPEWAQIPLRDYVGGALAKVYGKTGDEFAQYRQAAIDAETTLRARIAGGP